MSDNYDKINPEKAKTVYNDNFARAWLKRHLANRGYIIQESDALGPTKIMLNGMHVSYWERESVDVYKGGRSKGRARDYLFRLLHEQPWLHE